MQRQGKVPEIITYNALISVCEKGKQPERALEMFQALQRQGMVPDIITYSALISVCVSRIVPRRGICTCRSHSSMTGYMHLSLA